LRGVLRRGCVGCGACMICVRNGNTCSQRRFVGIKAAFGAVLVDQSTGEFQLRNAAGVTLTTGTVAASGDAVESVAGGQACSVAQPRVDCCPGDTCPTQQQCEAKAGCCYSPLQPNPGNQPWCARSSSGPSPPSPGPSPGPAPPTPPTPPSPPGNCTGKAYPMVDAAGPVQLGAPIAGTTQAECCAACDGNSACSLWVWATPGHEDGGNNCWLLSAVSGTVSATGRVLGVTRGPTPPLPPPPSVIAH
jgi:hypothetical protein